MSESGSSKEIYILSEHTKLHLSPNFYFFESKSDTQISHLGIDQGSLGPAPITIPVWVATCTLPRLNHSNYYPIQ